MAGKILFVDDELNIIISLKRAFRKEEHETFFANSGEEALEILENEKIDLIITDIKMPEMNGYELLKIVKERHPNVIRIALSGYSDKHSIFKALENSLIKYYIFKPWDIIELKDIINKLFDLKSNLFNRNILKIINNISNLPTLPIFYEELTALLEEDADMESIAQKIEEDQSITAKILKIVNSAFYQLKTGSVKEAITYIGLQNVKNIALANIAFSDNNSEELKEIWNHSLLTNSLACYLYRKLLKVKIPSTAAAAGLLYDIGKLVMIHHLDTNELFTVEHEEEKVQVNHNKLGGYLLFWWDLPLEIVETAFYHHTPLADEIINKELVAIIHVSGYYACEILGCNYEKNALEDGAFDILNTSKERVVSLIEEFKKTQRETIAHLV